MPASAPAPPACNTCFFTTAFPGVRLHDDGRCSECHHADIVERMARHRTGDLDDLRRIMVEARARSAGPYDCVVGASGGLDSSYTLFVARRLLKLNPLVIHYDHGLTHPYARSNLETLCHDLGVELVVVRSRGRHDQRFVKHTALALRELDLYWGICQFCNYAMSAVVWRYAKREGIAVALCSDNHYEGMLHIDRAPKMAAMRRALRAVPAARWPEMLGHAGAAAWHLLRLRMELYVPPVTNLVARRPRIVGPRYVTVSRYIDWDVPRMVETLERETGWRAPRPDLPMRFDCLLEDSLINHTWREATGLTVHAVIASNLVHAGLRTRSQLEDTVRHYDTVIPARREELERRLGTGRLAPRS